MTSRNGRKRDRGSIEKLPSGSLRVKVYAGIDPLTKKRYYLDEVIPAGPKADSEAEKVRRRLVSQVDERRNPKTAATLDQLLTRHLELLTVGPSTLRGYQTYVERHIRPMLGRVKIGTLGAEMLDSFYAELRRCQDHCDRRAKTRVDHRTRGNHLCDEHDGTPCVPADPHCRACQRRCKPHRCRPLSASTIRQIHYLLSGAYKRAVRWGWVPVSPITQAEPPPAPTPEPDPPSVEDAARIINAAWRDPDWGTLVWLAMNTGARRGELCALAWDCVDLDRGVLTLRRAVAKDDQGRWYIKDTKTHQQRRVALDTETVDVLREHRARAEACAAMLDITIGPQAFVFSLKPDRSAFLRPDSVTQRYAKLADRLGIDTHLHALRHYSATELISAGVDIRTVAGRLGHAGGGVTTLRVYSAWRSEADQRAAEALSGRMPPRPAPELDRAERAKTDPQAPYERIAARLRQDILGAVLAPGTPLPPEKQIAADNGVSAGTAHRAVALLNTWGLIEVSRGHRAVVKADQR